MFTLLGHFQAAAAAGTNLSGVLVLLSGVATNTWSKRCWYNKFVASNLHGINPKIYHSSSLRCVGNCGSGADSVGFSKFIRGIKLIMINFGCVPKILFDSDLLVVYDKVSLKKFSAALIDE